MLAAVLLAAAATLAPQQFAQLPLESALQKAVASSPDVAQARERVNENAALLAAARGISAPALTANYAAAPQGGPNNNTITQSLVTVGGQIVLGDYFASSLTVRQAAFVLAGAQYDLLESQRAERIKVSGQYYAALKNYAAVQIRKTDLGGAQADLRAAQLRFKAGDAPKLDVVRAEVAVASAQSALAAAQVDLENAQSALAIETGAPIESLAVLSNMQHVVDPPADVDRAVERALAQRADLASALQLERAEQAAVAVAQRGRLPGVTVSAGYTAGMDSGVAVHGPSANVNVVFPLSNEARAKADAERARLAQAHYKTEAIRRRILVDVGAAARTYAESLRATQSASRARIAAQQQLRATQIGYASGASSSLDVEVARRTYVSAALDELNAVYAQAQAAETLKEEMGP
jgi:outer membrane protein TolC